MKTLPRLALLLLLAAALGGPAPAASPTAGPQTGTEDDGQELETFVPSERLPADSAVAFPVDI